MPERLIDFSFSIFLQVFSELVVCSDMFLFFIIINIRFIYVATCETIYTAKKQQQSMQKTKTCDREAVKRPCSHQVEQPPSVRKYFFILSTFV